MDSNKSTETSTVSLETSVPETSLAHSQGVEPAQDASNFSTAPDGGTMAWLQCAGSFFTLFNIWGLLNSFGVFQDFYKRQFLPEESASRLSWVGSLQGCLLLAAASITGPIFDQGYARQLVFVGSVLIVLGMAMTSLAHEYWQIMLAQGLCTGLGGGCLFVPSLSIIPTFFTRKKATAMGVATAGAGLGGVIYAIVFYRLEPQIGFGWATRAIALIVLVTQLIPVCIVRQRIKPGRVRRPIDVSALHEVSFVFMGLSVFFASLGLFIPFFYVQLFAQQERIGNKSLDFYILAILNAGSCVGRLIPNIIADKVGPLYVLVSCTFAASILGFVWSAVSSLGGLITFAILYGLFAGSFISLGPTVVVATCPRLDIVGTRLGMILSCLAIGLLLGNPLGGAINRHGYLGLELFCGATVMVSALFLVCARVALTGPNLMRKV